MRRRRRRRRSEEEEKESRPVSLWCRLVYVVLMFFNSKELACVDVDVAVSFTSIRVKQQAEQSMTSRKYNEFACISCGLTATYSFLQKIYVQYDKQLSVHHTNNSNKPW